jgi:CubicO group peptidase (beta-lactamase class C family)
MPVPRLACLILAIACACTALAQSASTTTTQLHIHAIEAGLGPPITISGRPPEHRDILAEMQRLHVPAVSVAVIHNGELEWAKGYGVQSDGSAPVTPDTTFQAASISKSLTAMAALKLVAQGKLSLDAPIQTELKSWALPQTSFTAQMPITLRELLSHTAGVSVHGFAGYAADKPVPTLIQVLNGVKPANSAPILVEDTPGKKFSYSGGGFTIVQQMMIDQTGKPFPEIMKTLVLDPIGMRSSAYQQPLDSKGLNKVAMPVDDQGKPILGGPHTYPELAAAGLWTTPSDLARWVIEMQRSLAGHANHVLSAEMIRSMLTPVKDGYGLGVGIQTTNGKTSFSHLGGNEGYRCIYFAYENGEGAVIMTNSDNGGALDTELMGSIAREYGWPDYVPQQRTLVSVPRAEQRQFTGRFQIKNGPPIEIREAKASLQLSIGGDEPRQLFTSSSQSFFLMDDVMQLSFDSPNHGTVIFGTRRDSFERVPDATPKP